MYCLGDVLTSVVILAVRLWRECVWGWSVVDEGKKLMELFVLNLMLEWSCVR